MRLPKVVSIFSVCLFAGLDAGAALANGSYYSYGQPSGGLYFVPPADVRYVSKDLHISSRKITGTYVLSNEGPEDRTILFSFPMPDRTAGFDWWYAFDSTLNAVTVVDNMLNAATTVDGEPVRYTLHQSAFALGVDRTGELTSRGIPLIPEGLDVQRAIFMLPTADKRHLETLGLIGATSYVDIFTYPWASLIEELGLDMNSGEDYPIHIPLWTLHSAFTWESVIPAGETLTIVHDYSPAVGDSNYAPLDTYDRDERLTGPGEREIATAEAWFAEARQRYCVTRGMLEMIRRSGRPIQDFWAAPYNLRELHYMSRPLISDNSEMGNRFDRQAERFHVTVDMGVPQNMVAFCGVERRAVRQTGPSTFETDRTHYQWRDIEVLFFNYSESRMPH